jgi:hypothetical protein
MWRALVIAAALAGCGDNVKPAGNHDDAGAGSDASPPNKVIGPCLDRPTHAVVQLDGKLPCELISPAFHAEAAR